jgi:hypothetical protein
MVCGGSSSSSERCSLAPSLDSGGAAGIRTPDLRRAKAALSQLSYGPSVPVSAAGSLLPLTPTGGALWTRTTDLGLIRTAL